MNDLTAAFEQTETDVVRLYERIVRTSPTHVRHRVVTTTLLGVVAGWIVHQLDRPVGVALLAGATASTIAAVLYFWGGPAYNAWFWKRQLRDGRRAFLGHQTITLK